MKGESPQKPDDGQMEKNSFLDPVNRQLNVQREGGSQGREYTCEWLGGNKTGAQEAPPSLM